MIYYFKHILHHGLKGTYRGEGDDSLQKFTVNSTTTLVRYLLNVEHLNPPLTRNTEGQLEVSVLFPETTTLVEGHS